MASSSEDEDFLFKVQDDIFTETREQTQRIENAKEYATHAQRRTWGLAHRDAWTSGPVRDGSIEVASQTIYFQEKPGQQQRVWDCSLVLAKLLDNSLYFSTQYFDHKRVIELGCGIGIPGITAATRGAQEVLLTDMDSAIPWIQHNIQLNKSLISGEIAAVALDWNSISEQSPWAGQFDVILCSDLIYGDPDSTRLLVHALKVLCHATTQIISVYEARFAGDRGTLFFDLLKAEGFQIEAIPMDKLDEIYRGDNLFAHIFTLAK